MTNDKIPTCTAEGCPKLGLHFTTDAEKRAVCESHYLEVIKLQQEARERERLAASAARDAEIERAMRSVLHDDDGVVIEDAPPLPPKKKRKRAPKLARETFLSATERAELEAQAQWRLEERERKEKTLAAVRELLPVEHTQTQGEPRFLAEPLIPLDERTAAGEVLADVKRPNGSRFVVMAKRYDGTGAGFGARTYIHAAVWFRKNAGTLYRSKGVAIERAEMRAFAAALNAEADRLDAEDQQDDVGGGEP